MKGRFPVYVIFLNLPLSCVDVNVHPSKKEVKFDNPNKIFSLTRRAIENTLLSVNEIQNFISFDEKTQENDEKIEKNDIFNEIFAKKLTPLKENEGRSFQENTTETIDQFDIVSDIEPIKPPQEDLLKNFENITLKGSFYEDDDKKLSFNSSNQFSSQIIKEDKFLSASIKDEMKILGTVFLTYIVIEYDNSIYFIDQHAGHERILYDRLVKNINENNIAKQDLLVPFEFSLGAKESVFIDENIPYLNEIGFEIEKIDKKYYIKSVPLVLSAINLDSFVDEIVKESIQIDKKPSDYIHDKLCQSACKHAIKAGDKLTGDDCAYLIGEVRKGVMLCPHGRPISLIISKHEFEKMFKRVL